MIFSRLTAFCAAATFSFAEGRKVGLASTGRKQLGGSPMGLTLKLDVLAVLAAFSFLGAIVFGAF
jgi:hypothetical protein